MKNGHNDQPFLNPPACQAVVSFPRSERCSIMEAQRRSIWCGRCFAVTARAAWAPGMEGAGHGRAEGWLSDTPPWSCIVHLTDSGAFMWFSLPRPDMFCPPHPFPQRRTSGSFSPNFPIFLFDLIMLNCTSECEISEFLVF